MKRVLKLQKLATSAKTSTVAPMSCSSCVGASC
jgi:hypothetical protein